MSRCVLTNNIRKQKYYWLFYGMYRADITNYFFLLYLFAGEGLGISHNYHTKNHRIQMVCFSEMMEALVDL